MIQIYLFLSFIDKQSVSAEVTKKIEHLTVHCQLNNLNKIAIIVFHVRYAVISQAI